MMRQRPPIEKSDQSLLDSRQVSVITPAAQELILLEAPRHIPFIVLISAKLQSDEGSRSIPSVRFRPPVAMACMRRMSPVDVSHSLRPFLSVEYLNR